jgi:hypothetical protein
MFNLQRMHRLFGSACFASILVFRLSGTHCLFVIDAGRTGGGLSWERSPSREGREVRNSGSDMVGTVGWGEGEGWVVALNVQQCSEPLNRRYKHVCKMCGGY